MFRKNNNIDPRYMDYQTGIPNMYQGLEANRLIYEIKENRRRINNLAKRITRIESYLKIPLNLDILKKIVILMIFHFN